MDNVGDAEWIVSRKIVVKSLTRHFAPWKKRFFLLDRANAVLGVRSSATSGMILIPLSAPSLSIQRHEYGGEDKYLLTLKFTDDENTSTKEIVMKFDSQEDLLHWETSLKVTAENARSVTTGSTTALLQTFIDYMSERMKLQSLASSESECEGGYYGSNAPPSEKPSGRSESPVDPLDVSFMACSNSSSTIADEAVVAPEEAPASAIAAGAIAGAGHPVQAPETDTAPATSLIPQRHTPELMARPVPEESRPKLPDIRIRPLRVPRMHILLIAVGTRGDMQPFVQLGCRLLQDGHRARIATHECFRDFVLSKGLEFYPLAGDPLKLSEFMVKTQGFVIPTTPELIMQAPIYHRMVVDMMYSCWGACVDPDPQDPSARPFVADAIISNPVSYAHIHCAEALGIPLHLMFPQPWTPTKAFPHPLSCLSYQAGWSSENFISYQLVDSMMWMSFERHINAFRTNILGLEPLRVGEGGWNQLNIMKVPFVKMWSPSFVPKPKDWPSYVDVVGTFFDTVTPAPAPAAVAEAEMEAEVERFSTKEGAVVATGNAAEAPSGGTVGVSPTTGESPSQTQAVATVAKSGAASPSPAAVSPVLGTEFTPPEHLVRFLESGPSPIFVGFGSMVVKDLEALVSMFLEGAALAGVRIIVQLGWTEISQQRFLELALQAQLKASIVREAEHFNDRLSNSTIFPSDKEKSASTRVSGSTVESVHDVTAPDSGVVTGAATAHAPTGPSKAITAAALGIAKISSGSMVDLTMSVRSVESNGTVEEGESHNDDSTLDGEGLLNSVSLPGAGKEVAASNMYTSSITATSTQQSVCRASEKAGSTLEEGEFDASPISTPDGVRRKSAERSRSGEHTNGNGNGNGTGSGLGKWLFGAAASLTKSFQSSPVPPSNSGKSGQSGQSGHSGSSPASDDNAAPSTTAAASSRLSGISEDPTRAPPAPSGDDWDEVHSEGWSAAKDALFIGPCPHDWLFQRVAGVVHHGGAGTTAAGLRHGRPTWVCPFFGDQHFWGEMVHRRRVGPKPCPIGALTVPLIAEGLAILQDSKTIASAAALAANMSHEDGVEAACAAFYKHLPLESMLCDVSLFRGEHRLAQVYCQDCGLKMCREVSQELHSAPGLHLQGHRVGPCCFKDWTRPTPNNAAEGLLQGIGGLVHELKEGVSDLVYDPVSGIYKSGWSGAAAGLTSGLNSLLSRPLAGGSVLLNKVKEGIRASLASNLNYGVTPSGVDPIALERGAAEIDDTPFTARSNPVANEALVERIRRLKLSLPELAPIYDLVDKDPVTPLDLLSPVPLTPQIKPPSDVLSSSAGQHSPLRGRQLDRVSEGTEAETPVGFGDLKRSFSHSSMRFYSAKQGKLPLDEDDVIEEGADGDEDDVDSDSSEYCPEEPLPFALAPSDPPLPAPQEPSPTLAAGSPDPDAEPAPDVDADVAPNPEQKLTRQTSFETVGDDEVAIPAGSVKVVLSPVSPQSAVNEEAEPVQEQEGLGTQLMSQVGAVLSLVNAAVTLSTTGTVGTGSITNANQHGSSRATPRTIAPAKIHTTRIAGAGPADMAAEHVRRISVEEAYSTAQAAQKLFSEMGARNGRYFGRKEFSQAMQRAVAREAALKHHEQQQVAGSAAGSVPAASEASAEVGLNESYDALDEHPLPSLAALAAAATGLRQPRLNEQSITALIQVIGHGKRYVDFVDFSLLYRDLLKEC